MGLQSGRRWTNIYLSMYAPVPDPTEVRNGRTTRGVPECVRDAAADAYVRRELFVTRWASTISAQIRTPRGR